MTTLLMEKLRFKENAIGNTTCLLTDDFGILNSFNLNPTHRLKAPDTDFSEACVMRKEIKDGKSWPVYVHGFTEHHDTKRF